MHKFDISVFIPLGFVDNLLVGWIWWVVVSPHDLGVHVWLSPPEYFPVGWVLLSLGWVHAYVFLLRVRW